MIVHEVGHYDFLVTKDRHFTQRQTVNSISLPLGLRVGNAEEALAFCRDLHGVG